MIAGAGPWGTGPNKLIEGFATPEKRTNRIILEANTKYWDRSRMPRLRRIVFENTLTQKDAVERVKTTEGRVDVVSKPTRATGIGAASPGSSASPSTISSARRTPWSWSKRVTDAWISSPG